LGLISWIKSRYIDGSRIHITGFSSDLMDVLMSDVKETLGYYDSDNNIYLNPEFINDSNLKDICSIISHEFIHMVLRWEQSKDISLMFDNICPEIIDIYTDCGGL